ncbi:hypothetical protein PIB30_067796 [Stylosanthes scabra]|uniref:Uncharacterized protein n=1 Tax=Stylosanthes scabra TaxID=79078 RepID=A0ABU6XMF5_9FABA|nr:hypothetical protein [Stylosanthes scabra]
MKRQEGKQITSGVLSLGDDSGVWTTELQAEDGGEGHGEHDTEKLDGEENARMKSTRGTRTGRRDYRDEGEASSSDRGKMKKESLRSKERSFEAFLPRIPRIGVEAGA